MSLLGKPCRKDHVFSASATAWQFKIFTSIRLIGMSLLYNRFQ